MYKLKELKPEKVFGFFEEMSQIPRTSGDEKKISDWLVTFAKERNLEVYQDEVLNVIIRKPGTPGYENSPGVIIQGHMDMVGEKSKESTHDFSKDPINLRIDGDYVYATDTTLGADDGIAVAYGLAILDSDDIPHPPLELLVTTSEETGMNGAIDLDASPLKGKVLLNIDAEEEGIFLVSCAGGNTVYTTFSAEYENDSRKAYEISVTGLKGGHSGIEINKQRGNAVKLLGRVLKRISREMEIRIASISGGAKHNAIAREAAAIITVPEMKVSTVKGILDEMNKTFVNEFATEDPEIVVGIKEASCERVMSEKATKGIIDYMNIVPDGVQTISREIEGLVVSSLNLGVLEEKEDKVI
ncbi:MAG: beta-Ala-His dipeptidase, partial [Clostridiaceae bacterium]